jgi:hypothetical protein
VEINDSAIIKCNYRVALQLRRLIAGFPPWQPGFDPRSGYVGFMVDKVALGQVLFEYFGFPCRFLFRRLLHTHHHLSSGAGTIGQIVADVPSGLSPTPPQEKCNYELCVKSGQQIQYPIQNPLKGHSKSRQYIFQFYFLEPEKEKI